MTHPWVTIAIGIVAGTVLGVGLVVAGAIFAPDSIASF
jgi:hypothetical protein